MEDFESNIDDELNVDSDPQDNNIDGETAESLVHGRINTWGSNFRARRLGGKWPIVDMYVEFDHGDSICYFFVQVKSTRNSITPFGKLRVGIPRDKLIKLSKYNAPTYLIGVDLQTESSPSFILTIRGKVDKGIAVMPSDETNKLSWENLARLKQEVVMYWANSEWTNKDEYATNFEYNG